MPGPPRRALAALVAVSLGLTALVPLTNHEDPGARPFDKFASRFRRQGEAVEPWVLAGLIQGQLPAGQLLLELTQGPIRGALQPLPNLLIGQPTFLV